MVVAGPTTTQVILNSLQMGFRTLAIQKRSSEVWSLLGTVRNEFGKFGDLLEKTHKKLQEASNTIESATAKTRNIQGKLNKVQDLPEGSGIKVLATPKDPVEKIVDEEIPLISDTVEEGVGIEPEDLPF